MGREMICSVLQDSKNKRRVGKKNMNLEQAYDILEKFYEEIPGEYDDNWIDYNMETAMRERSLKSARILFEKAMESGGKDNITVMTLQITDNKIA